MTSTAAARALLGNTTMNTPWALAALCAAIVVSGCGCDGRPEDGPICDAASLTEALDRAAVGSTVRVGACRIEGSFTVPAGVTLEGAGVDRTVLVARGGPSVRLTPGATAARLTDASIESAGPAGIVASGAGEASVERVAVRATRGFAIGAESVDTLRIADVVLDGPITADSIPGEPPTVATTATHGLIVLRSATATISGTTVHGFASVGALFVQSSVRWSGGAASGNLGVGLMVYGGSATLDGVEVCDTLRPIDLDPSYAMLFAQDAVVETHGVHVCRNGSYGILQSGARSTNVDLLAELNHEGAIRVQRSDSFELSGPGTVLTGNGLAAIAAVESSGISVRDARIAGTLEVTDISGTTGVRIGDGIHLLRSVTDVRLSGLHLDGNERVGVLIDADGQAADSLVLEAIEVDGTADQLGVIAQRAIVGPNWDRGVTRLGATAANDSAFHGVLDVVSIVGPNWAPPSDVESGGLSALLGM